MDHILLYIDNQAHALAHALKTVRDNLDKDRETAVHRMETFIRVYAADVMSRNGDRDSARYLRQELRSAPKERSYWDGVYQHYLNKHNEGCRMEDYLAESK